MIVMLVQRILRKKRGTTNMNTMIVLKLPFFLLFLLLSIILMAAASIGRTSTTRLSASFRNERRRLKKTYNQQLSTLN